jgi:hypothetical protein
VIRGSLRSLRGTTTCEQLANAFVGGTLRCNASCGFDTSECIQPVCGDGRAEGNEACDGDDVRQDGGTCVGRVSNAIGGLLKCAADCQLDTSDCVYATCGDGIVEASEDCDGSDLGQYTGKTCADFRYGTSIFLVPVNYQSGTLRCASHCDIDWTGCVPAPGCYIGVMPKLPRIICH